MACAIGVRCAIAQAMNIAIIGAGMAGLTCGEILRENGHDVRLFDKGRGPGGRMATRRMEHGGQTLHFDHGAQFFTAHDPRFAARISRWEADGVVAQWPAAKLGAWVGVPGMNGPIKAMAAAQNVQFGARVEAIVRDGAGWSIAGEGIAEATFDALVVAVPAEQVAPLLGDHAPDFAAAVQAVVSDPCWTVMAAFDAPVAHPSDTIRNAGAIGWAARNSAKPERGVGETWVLQASPDWSRAHLELEQDEIVELLLAELSAQTGDLPPLAAATAHRWRYAQAGRSEHGALWDATAKIGACGDWLVGPRVESAFLSGVTLAEQIAAA